MSAERTTLTPETETAAEMRRGGRTPRYLAQSVHAAGEGGAGLAGRAAALAGITVAALVLWAGFIPVDDAIVAAGRVVPTGDARVVTHPDGGRIADIAVKDGQVVDHGQILIRFADDALKEHLSRARNEYTQVRLLAAQLRALDSGNEPDFTFALPEHDELVARERLVFASLRRITDDRRQAVARRVQQAEARVKSIKAREAKLTKESDLLEEELLVRKELLQKGLASKEVHRKAQQNVARAHKRLANLIDARQVAEKALKEAQAAAEAFNVRLKERAEAEIDELTAKLDGLEKTLDEIERKIGRVDVAAPVKGLVRGVGRYATDATVPPGSVIGEIVPMDGEAVVEARIAVADVHRVEPGMAVSVVIQDKAFQRYGGITGTLKEISSSTYEDEKGKPYYAGVVALDRHQIGSGETALKPRPGMKARARIRTVSRPLFRRILGF